MIKFMTIRGDIVSLVIGVLVPPWPAPVNMLLL
jgi:hypothetical protein